LINGRPSVSQFCLFHAIIVSPQSCLESSTMFHATRLKRLAAPAVDQRRRPSPLSHTHRKSIHRLTYNMYTHLQTIHACEHSSDHVSILKKCSNKATNAPSRHQMVQDIKLQRWKCAACEENQHQLANGGGGKSHYDFNQSKNIQGLTYAMSE
jgi:hypothetical protein